MEKEVERVEKGEERGEKGEERGEKGEERGEKGEGLSTVEGKSPPSKFAFQASG